MVEDKNTWYTIHGLERLISSQALAVLDYLHHEQCIENAEAYMDVTTSAWYNGRECGICLEVAIGDVRDSLIITFGEHRNSDAIFVDCWKADRSRLNPPTVRDFTDEAYEERRYFNYGAVVPATEYITDLIESFVLQETAGQE